MAIRNLKKSISSRARSVLKQIERHPLASFLTLFTVLIVLIVIGNIIRKPKPATKQQIPVKSVSVYRIGQAPRITLQGQVEKSGVVQITSLMGGVVQSIPVQEGANVWAGQSLIILSTNYQGGNALALSRQISQKQYQNAKESLPLQLDLIQKQRDIANSTLTNFEKMRDISAQSVGATQDLINLNNDIISTLDASIAVAATPADALPLKQLKSQFESANLQLNTALRNTQYQTNTTNPPTQLAQLQKDITLKQLDIQEKAQKLNVEIAKLSLQVAQVTEANMYPAAPFQGTIQHISVRVGQAVAPGTTLATLSSSQANAQTVYVYTSKDIADKVSRAEPSILHFGKSTLNLYPSYISTEAVQGSLYAVAYSIPQDVALGTTDKTYVSVEIPMGYADSGITIPYVPLDVIYQSQENASVFVIQNGKVVSKPIQIGQVVGSYVEVTSGISNGDQIILDRTVIEGDSVRSLN